MLNALQPAQHVRRHESWSDFLDQLGTASLTLIGFEGEDLPRIYDALEVCSKTRNLQAVEVFIYALEEVFETEASMVPGLCLVRIPDSRQERGHRKALRLLSRLADDDTLTVIPVLRPHEARRSVLDAIGETCPTYLNSESELRDFVAMFNAFLFLATRDHAPIQTDSALVDSMYMLAD